MEQILLHTHSVIRWVFLILLIFTCSRSIMGYIQKQKFDKFENILSLLTMVFAHVQLLIGIVLYFISPLIKNTMETSGFMKEKSLREMVIEHPIGMILAIILITIGRIKQKKAKNDKSKFMKLIIFYTIALLLILFLIPWSRG